MSEHRFFHDKASTIMLLRLLLILSLCLFFSATRTPSQEHQQRLKAAPAKIKAKDTVTGKLIEQQSAFVITR